MLDFISAESRDGALSARSLPTNGFHADFTARRGSLREGNVFNFVFLFTGGRCPHVTPSHHAIGQSQIICIPPGLFKLGQFGLGSHPTPNLPPDMPAVLLNFFTWDPSPLQYIYWQVGGWPWTAQKCLKNYMVVPPTPDRLAIPCTENRGSTSLKT